MKELYQKVMEAIDTEVAAIKWIDFNMGQFRMETPPVSWPCALIDLSSGDDYETLGENCSIGQITVEISLGFKLYERTHSVANNLYRTEALSHIDIVEQVRAAVENTVGASFTPLEYRGFGREQRVDPRIWTLRFVSVHTTGIDNPVSDPYQPWPGPGAGPVFCEHADIA